MQTVGIEDAQLPLSLQDEDALFLESAQMRETVSMRSRYTRLYLARKRQVNSRRKPKSMGSSAQALPNTPSPAMSPPHASMARESTPLSR